jgi:hypothetical protein
MKKELEEMVDNELDDFYSDQDESENKFKLLLEFEPSLYKYEGSLFEFSEKSKKVVKAKEVKLGRRKHKGLF